MSRDEGAFEMNSSTSPDEPTSLPGVPGPPLGNSVSRREFLKTAALPCLAAGAMGTTHGSPAQPWPLAESDAQFVTEAKFYEKLPYKKIKCKLCPRECVIDDKERGYCGVRENRGGTYYTLLRSA